MSDFPGVPIDIRPPSGAVQGMLQATGGLSGAQGSASPLAVGSGAAYLAAFRVDRPTGPLEESTDEPIRSLAPSTPGMYRDKMLEGEKYFREKEYLRATNSFKLAGNLSQNSPESQLSLMRTHFAAAGMTYHTTAYYLREALEGFPELALVDIHPRDFYQTPEDYKIDLDRLEEHVREHTYDPNGHLVLGYLRFRDGKYEEAQKQLELALGTMPPPGPGEKFSTIGEAVRTLWRGMVAGGYVQGDLTPRKPGTEMDSQDESASTDEAKNAPGLNEKPDSED